MNKKLRYLGLLLILPVFTVALTSTWQTLPAANALTSRSNFNDNHYTALYPGGPRICGGHVCSPGEYDKMQQELAQAQMKGKTGTTSTQGQNMMQKQNMTDHNMMQQQNMMHGAMTSSDLGSVLKLSNANL